MSTTYPWVREFLQITEESAYLTPVVSPVRGTSQIPIRLSGQNFWTGRANPVAIDIPYGGGFAVTSQSVSDKTEIKGVLQTPLCYSQANMLLGWATTKITGGTAPWTTSEPNGQFASCTIDHAIWQDDTSTYKRKRYLGCKVDQWGISVSSDSQIAMLNLSIVGSTVQGNTFDSSTDPSASAFPVPTDQEYASDFVLFNHSVGALTLNSSAFAEYTSLNLGGNNKHISRYYANRFVQVLRSFGRDLNIDADVTLVSSPDFRETYFNVLAPLSTEVVFTNGTHTLTFNYESNGRLKSLSDDLPLADLYTRKWSLMSRYDTSSAADFAFTYA